MPEPSSAFSSRVEPCPAGRGFVLAAGGILGAAGSVPVGHLCPGLLSLGIWTTLVALRLWLLGRRFREVTAFRLAADQMLETRDRSGVWHPATILPGTAVVGRAVWLRYQCGISRVELLLGDPDYDPGWRRFLVLLRHRSVASES